MEKLGILHLHVMGGTFKRLHYVHYAMNHLYTPKNYVLFLRMNTITVVVATITKRARTAREASRMELYFI